MRITHGLYIHAKSTLVAIVESTRCCVVMPRWSCSANEQTIDCTNDARQNVTDSAAGTKRSGTLFTFDNRLAEDEVKGRALVDGSQSLPKDDVQVTQRHRRDLDNIKCLATSQ